MNTQLPIDAVAKQVCCQLQNSNVVLQAEPGAGKSTGLPLHLLRAGFDGKIVMLEPRRLAARNVAARLASQLGERMGSTIGLRMRGHSESSSDTRLEVVTEGVLTRMLQKDPLLDGVAVVIFDEFHERSLHADLGLALCLDVQQGLREDLRLLLMSATLDGAELCSHLGLSEPVVCTVRQHPVDIIWCAEGRELLSQRVASVTSEALQQHSGDALVFLPGVAEIERTARLLETRLGNDVQLHKLHGGVAVSAQKAATAAQGQIRRVILSTSIAETSITIDGVRIVIDAGVERRSRIDVSSGAERLETVMASQASAIQRAGRAGRTQTGVCYRLWAESGHGRRAVRWQPEILRAELSSLVLELGQWGVTDPAALPWIDPPPASAVQRAHSLLQQLGLWNDGALNERGRAVARLPLHPRLGHMVLWGNELAAAKNACALAALLEELPRQRKGADLSVLLQQPSKTRSRRTSQLQCLLPRVTAQNSQPSPAVLLSQAYPDRIARRRPGQDARYLLSSGAGATIASDDALAQSEWLVVAELGGAANEVQIFSALEITVQELEVWCADFIDQTTRIDWDDRNKRVIAESQRRLGAIVLEAKPLQNVGADQRAAALMEGVRRRGLQCLDWTEDALEWQARVRRMGELTGDDSGYPQVDEQSLLANLSQWLQPWVNNISSLKALAQINLLHALTSMLDYPQQRKLDAWLPRRYTVPSGSQHKLRYACDGNPVLAVKLQEMFGCRENPTVANGRLPLKIELLSPARRPVQITEDLANFWTNSYPEVKKDLAGRYPRHPWPDDPVNAVATAHAKSRRS